MLLGCHCRTRDVCLNCNVLPSRVLVTLGRQGRRSRCTPVRARDARYISTHMMVQGAWVIFSRYAGSMRSCVMQRVGQGGRVGLERGFATNACVAQRRGCPHLHAAHQTAYGDDDQLSLTQRIRCFVPPCGLGTGGLCHFGPER